MNFKVGQEVIVKRNLGRARGHLSNSEYYHGGDLNDVPLGAKAIIYAINGPDSLTLKFENGEYGNSGIWAVHPGELIGNEKLDQARKEYQEKLDALLSGDAPVIEADIIFDARLDDILLDDAPIVEKNNGNSKGLMGRIKRFFDYKHNHIQIGRPFDPKFNVREEFAVWMREEFPDLDLYTGQRGAYKELETRREEVYKAAVLACEHGIETTGACVQATFSIILDHLKDTDYHFNIKIYELVDFIEKVSANLDTKEERHYGTRLDRRRLRDR